VSRRRRLTHPARNSTSQLFVPVDG
jgi:hypothetical protein